MFNRLRQLFRVAIPLRYHLVRFVDQRFDLLPYPLKLDYNTVERPWYGHPLLHAAKLARKLGYKQISAIEFGVAGGNGLLALELHAAHVTRETGVTISIFGFDTGRGMPQPLDYRDMPYLWQAGYYSMDEDLLRARLQSSTLILGPVETTLPAFFEKESPPPIGFIAFDLDYYSSTVSALKVLEAEHKYLLPRVACYVDDMVGDVDWAYHEFAGELLAIKEFNAAHEDMKVAPVQGLRFYLGRLPQVWHEQIFVAHIFRHPDYNRPISDMSQLPLSNA
jgi:hypothetical protein